MTVGYVGLASMEGITLDELEIEAGGTLDLRGFFAMDENVPAGYEEIEVVVRIAGDGTPEQFPLASVLDRYPNAKDVRWVQAAPANQGPWPYFGLELPEKLPERLADLKRVSRRRMAAPAPGSSKVHEVEQADIIEKAFT